MLCSPGSCVPRALSSKGPKFPGSYVPRVPYSQVPNFPGVLCSYGPKFSTSYVPKVPMFPACYVLRVLSSQGAMSQGYADPSSLHSLNGMLPWS